MTMVGIDEVGRGCWAGPLVAGAVVLGAPISGLNDSKKLTALARSRLAKAIESQAVAIGLGWVTPKEVDQLGMTAAVRLAMERALAEIACQWHEVIIDGDYNFLSHITGTRAVVKADATVPAVSAASIVAKVARDTYMIQRAALEYPNYQFDKHVGYGTKLHHDTLKKFGACELHRMSYKPLKELAL